MYAYKLHPDPTAPQGSDQLPQCWQGVLRVYSHSLTHWPLQERSCLRAKWTLTPDFRDSSGTLLKGQIHVSRQALQLAFVPVRVLTSWIGAFLAQ